MLDFNLGIGETSTRGIHSKLGQQGFTLVFSEFRNPKSGLQNTTPSHPPRQVSKAEPASHSEPTKACTLTPIDNLLLQRILDLFVAMAGQYFSDPRPFYFVSVDEKLSFLNDCFPVVKKDSKFIESDIKKQPEKDKEKEKKEKEEKEKKEKDEADKKKVEDNSKIQTFELSVNICCDRCVRKVMEALEDVQGVEKVDCDQVNRKVLVKGSVKPEVVLKKVKKVKSDAKLVEKKK